MTKKKILCMPGVEKEESPTEANEAVNELLDRAKTMNYTEVVIVGVDKQDRATWLMRFDDGDKVYLSLEVLYDYLRMRRLEATIDCFEDGFEEGEVE